MAKKCELKSIESKRSASISVDVLHDGEGYILVSYNNGPKNYQGILMEVNRSGVPCGVKPPAWYDAARPGTIARSPDPNDPYHTVSTRMTYFQSHDLTAGVRRWSGDGSAAPVAPPAPAAKRRHHHHHKPGGRSTVRLRPRQVLCSNCKSMCTESSQSVQPAARRRRDGDENVDPAAAGAAAMVTAPPPPSLPAVELKPLVRPPASVSAPPPLPAEPPAPPPPLKVPRIPIVRLSAQQLRRSSSCGGGGGDGDTAGSCSGSSSSTTTSLSSSSASSSPTPPPTPTLTKLTVSPIKIVGNNVKKCDSTSSKPKLQKIKISGGAIVPPPSAPPAVPVTVPPEVVDVARRTGLRKKRLAVGSMEDLWDESVLDDGHRTASSEQEDAASLTPVLKISFGGREGAGTVLKIPAKYKLQAGEPESERTAPTGAAGPAGAGTGAALHPAAPTASAKAAKRALKKARKDVQRKLAGSPRASPAYHPWGARSPGYPRMSPSYPQMSPAYYRVAGALGLSPAHPGLSPAHPGLSPAHPGPAPAPAGPAAAAGVPAASPAASGGGPLRKKRHKHKLKHKRRRRERDERDEPATSQSQEAAEVRHPRAGGMKERCLSQKLSISLRRIRASEYAADAPSTSSAPAPAPAREEEPAAAGGESGVPPFPDTPSPPVDTSVSSCQLPDGRRLNLNDVIWGKVHGFPWWPGKVLCINDGGPSDQEAYVSWYGSTTSSLMPCSQLLPFLDTFESRVNRKRRGPYREAVRQATLEAERALPAAPSPAPVAATSAAAPAATAVPAPAQSPSHPPLALAGSPPEVDVAS